MEVFYSNIRYGHSYNGRRKGNDMYAVYRMAPFPMTLTDSVTGGRRPT